jgi:enoyl-CoA hydratase/carnithine racemase
MTSPEHVRLEQEGGVGVITLDRPDHHNAIDPGMLADLHGALDWAERTEGLRALVVTGSGDTFCAGADLHAFIAGWLARSRMPPSEAAREVLGTMTELARLVSRIRAYPYPVIAALNGGAVGGGFGLALACDMRVASTRARLGVGFIRIGASGAAMGISYLLPRLVGVSRALELMTTGEILSADQARELGLVSRVVDANRLRGEVLAVASRIASMPPLGLRASKSAVNLHLDATLEQALAHESHLQTQCLLSRDHYEGMRAFLEKRAPEFRGE